MIIERLNQLVKLSLYSNFKIISEDCNFWKYSTAASLWIVLWCSHYWCPR